MQVYIRKPTITFTTPLHIIPSSLPPRQLILHNSYLGATQLGTNQQAAFLIDAAHPFRTGRTDGSEVALIDQWLSRG